MVTHLLKPNRSHMGRDVQHPWPSSPTGKMRTKCVPTSISSFCVAAATKYVTRLAGYQALAFLGDGAL